MTRFVLKLVIVHCLALSKHPVCTLFYKWLGELNAVGTRLSWMLPGAIPDAPIVLKLNPYLEVCPNGNIYTTEMGKCPQEISVWLLNAIAPHPQMFMQFESPDHNENSVPLIKKKN